MVTQNRYLLQKNNELKSLLRNQNVQKGQTNDENDFEAMSDVMETDKQDFANPKAKSKPDRVGIIIALNKIITSWAERNHTHVFL